MKFLLKRKILVFSALVLIAAILLGYTYFIEPNRLIVNRTELKIKNWNPAFDNLKIAVISDIHGGSNNVTEEKIRRIVQLTNAQNPDVVMLVGDYVSQQFSDRRKLKMPVATIADNLEGFNAKYGVFAVLGNHDGWHDDDEIAAEFRRVGIRVLVNEIAFIEKDGKSCVF
jgi:predicted MPP superfamily phosphohydrolase